MIFSPRIRLKSLAALCRRVATAWLAGVDARTIWARESQNARGRAAHQCFGAISQAVNQGESVAGALATTGRFFPSFFHEMVKVGEQSGHMGEVFAQLAEFYQDQAQRRRMFVGAIAWPMLQLFLAVAIIGFLIWATGLIGKMTGVPIDILGVGLVGERGLAIYLGIVATVAVVLIVLVQAVVRGLAWTRPIQRAILRVPVIGPAFQTLALARLAWSMYQTMNAAMEVRQALQLSLRSTNNARYTDLIERVDADIAEGNSVHHAFSATGRFPPDFLDALEVGEHSGQLVESMGVLARQYHDQARSALATLTTVAGFAVWMLVAALIIVLIFRIFLFYLGAITDALPK